MSHAGTLLAILERERRRREAREARYARLHAALRRGHERRLRCAALLEASDATVQAAAAARAHR